MTNNVKWAMTNTVKRSTTNAVKWIMGKEFHSVVAGRSKITRQFKSEYSTDKTRLRL